MKIRLQLALSIYFDTICASYLKTNNENRCDNFINSYAHSINPGNGTIQKWARWEKMGTSCQLIITEVELS